MNLLYLHANLFRDTYRCKQVRQRLRGFMIETAIDFVFIGGVDRDTLTKIEQIKARHPEFDIPVFVRIGRYQIEDELVELDATSLTIDDQRFIPQDGSVVFIETDPEVKGNYIALDFFADENFADYHGEIDAQSLNELIEFMHPEPKQSKRHLN